MAKLSPITLGVLSIGELALEIQHLGFEEQDPADTGQGHPFTREPGRFLHGAYLILGVAALTARGSGWLHHFFTVQPAQVSGLHAQHVGDLAHGIERGLVIVEG